MRFATISLVALTSPASAQVQPAAPQRVKVALANFSFTPTALHLMAGRPVVMHFVNQGSGCLSYSAPEFFGSAVPGGKAP